MIPAYRRPALALVLLLATALRAGPALANDTERAARAMPDREAVYVVLTAQADVSAAYRLGDKSARGRYVFARLRATAEASQGPLVAWLERRGAVVKPYHIANVLAVEADRATIDAVRARPGVAAVEPQGTIRLVDPVEGEPSLSLPLLSVQAPQAAEPGIRDIGADKAWRLGYEGQDIVVAITDTGAAFKHPALKNTYRGLDSGSDYNWFDAVSGEEEPLDEHGHGTHVTGTVVGKAGSRMIGVAPEARWIACRIIRERSGPDAAALNCLQWLLAPTRLDGTEPRPEMAPDVINASWGGDQKDCDGSIALRRAIGNLQAAGILFVASAGNAGNGCSTICAPGAYPESLTVGNYDTRTRRIADSSSRGPIGDAETGEIKPDVAAPGTDINSSLPPSRYGKMTGTSMAAPHVTGAAALLLDARPELRGRPEIAREILTSTADGLRPDRCGPEADEGPNNSAGYGVVDVEAAVVLALTATPWPTATATPTRTATPTASTTPTASATSTRRPPVWSTPRPTPDPVVGTAVFLPALHR